MPGYRLFVALHVISGVVALLGFWTAASLKKGSPRHRLVGRVYLLAMCGILANGVPMTAHFLLTDRPVAAAFLGYLLVITGQAMWMAWRAVTDKRDWRAMVARPAWRGWMLANLGSGTGVLALGVVLGQALFMGFAAIGILLGLQMLWFARRGPKHANWHVVQHYQAILGCGIATHVAFLTIAMRPAWAWLRAHAALPEAVAQLFPWFAPVVVAVLAGLWLDRRYARPLAATPPHPARPLRSLP